MNNPIQAMLILACVGFVLISYFFLEVMLLRLSCNLAKVPRPSVVRTMGIVIAVLGAVSIAEGVLGGIINEAYERGGYPLWEAGLVGFFLGLPVHMVVCSAIHAKLAGIPLTHGIAVWFIEKSIKLVMVLIGGCVIGGLMLMAKGAA